MIKTRRTKHIFPRSLSSKLSSRWLNPLAARLSGSLWGLNVENQTLCLLQLHYIVEINMAIKIKK